MPAIWRAWASAWEQVPSTREEHDLVRRVLSGEKYGVEVPSRRTVRATFSTVFTDGRYGMAAFHDPKTALPARLRSQKVVTSFMQITEAEADSIVVAVRWQRDRLVRTCRFFDQLVRWAGDVDLTELSEALLGLAVKLTYQHEELDDHVAEAAAAALVVAGPESLKVYLDALGSDSDVERTLRNAWASSEPSRSTGDGDSPANIVADRTPFWRFLGVFAQDPTAPGTWVVTEPADWWEAVKEEPLGPWPLWAREVHLVGRLPLTRPALRAARTVPEHHFVSRLDSSLEARLASALRDDRAKRASLPDLEVLVADEIARACSPLGVATEESRALLVLAETLTQQVSVVRGDESDPVTRKAMLGAGSDGMRLETSRAADHVRAHLDRWRAEQEQARGRAGIPHVWASALADPTPYFLSYLWTRVHNAEVHGVRGRSAQEAYDLLTGIGHTLTNRLKSLPAAAARMFLVADDELLDDHAVGGESRSHLMLDQVELVRDATADGEWSAFWALVYGGQAPADAEDTWRAWADAAGADLGWADLESWIEERRPERPGNGSLPVDTSMENQ